jgi:hypothetical protein
MRTFTITTTVTPTLALIAWLLVPPTAHGFYNSSTGRWLSRDPVGEQGGLNPYAFVANDPPDYIDTDGRFTGTKCLTCGQWYQGWHDCGSKSQPPIDCSAYSALGGVSCKDCSGKTKKDSYPQQAQTFCEGFKKLYTGSAQQGQAACVAQCLIGEEKKCQSKYPTCNHRNCCRLLAHFKCYAKCFFWIPAKGMPPGAWDFGFNELVPACEAVLGEVPPPPY